MLDKPEKTRQLMATLKAALPFEVELTPYALAQIRSQGIDRAVEPRQIVSEVSFAGDEGGIVCHLLPRETDNVIILSLTHVRVHRKNPFAAAVFDYQKHRGWRDWPAPARPPRSRERDHARLAVKMLSHEPDGLVHGPLCFFSLFTQLLRAE